MKKTGSADLLQEIGHDLVVYLRDGYLGVGSFLKGVDPSLSDLQKLLEVHFVLQDDVIEFVRSLPENVRRLKTISGKATETSDSLIRGRIIWTDTLRERFRRNPADQTHYVNQVQVRNLQVKENVVLIEFLQVLRRILTDQVQPLLHKEYQWLQRWIEPDLIRDFLHVVDRNIYLQQIVPHRVSQRMINDTRDSRMFVYAQAADLLDQYYSLTNPSRWHTIEDYHSKITEFFRKTFITPANADTLFELYWAIKVIRNLPGQASLEVIDSTSGELACAEDDYFKYEVYHDRIPEDLGFSIGIEELANGDNQYAQRLYWSRKRLRRLGQEIFGRSADSIWGGRPDILVVIRSKVTGDLVKLIIGEVKNTVEKGYAAEGLKQLLDYIAFVKYKNQYILNRYDDHTVQVEGMLFLNSIRLDLRHSENVSVYALQHQDDLHEQITYSWNQLPQRFAEMGHQV